MKKIIFLDIDGTIRDFDGYIPESTITAVQAAKAAGHEICICTGRSYHQIEERIINMGFDGIIAGSGSFVQYKGSTLRHTGFTSMTYLVLCTYLIDHNCILELQCYDNSYVLHSQAEEFRVIGKRIMDKLGLDAEKLVKSPKIIDSLLNIHDVEKVLYFSNEISVEELRKKWGNDIVISSLSIPTEEKWSGEISPRDINKAEGIRCILESSAFEHEDVIAIGDNDNDTEMIRFAAMGVAMGNAVDALKEQADMVTDSLRNDGLYKAFMDLGLMNTENAAS